MNRAVFIFFLLAFANCALAHPEGFSGLKVKVVGREVHAALTLHTRDMGDWFPPGRYKDYVNDVCAALKSSASQLVQVDVEGNVIVLKTVKTFSPEVGLIEVDMDYELPEGAKEMQVWSKHLAHLPWGHQQSLVVEDEKGKTLCNQVLTLEEDAAEVEMSR